MERRFRILSLCGHLLTSPAQIPTAGPFWGGLWDSAHRAPPPLPPSPSSQLDPLSGAVPSTAVHGFLLKVALQSGNRDVDSRRLLVVCFCQHVDYVQSRFHKVKCRESRLEECGEKLESDVSSFKIQRNKVCLGS